MILPLDPVPVDEAPFPHAVVDNFLDPDAYRGLRDSFPPCPLNSGPTGFSCFPGDAAYDALLAAQPVWRAFHDETQSQTFVDFMLAQFAPVIAAQSRVDLSHARFADYVESRADKEARHLPETGLPADALFVRTDILQGNVGYDRRAHVDHRRRAATMLIYFCDGDEARMAGGDLVLHHADGSAAATVRPRHNRMAMFPCINSSLHSVSPITAQAAPRNFVQITLSSSVDLWEPIPEPPRPGRMARALNRLIGR
jgi:hypothetical protein